MRTTVKALEKRQDQLHQRIPAKYWDTIKEMLDIEYRLTMVAEGHDSELEE